MFSLRTTSIKAALVLLCLGAASAAAQINPNQINWPSCSAGQSYVPYSNACVSFAPLASPADVAVAVWLVAIPAQERPDIHHGLIPRLRRS